MLERSDGVQQVSEARPAAQEQTLIACDERERGDVHAGFRLQPMLTLAEKLYLEPAAPATLDVKETPRVEGVGASSDQDSRGDDPCRERQRDQIENRGTDRPDDQGRQRLSEPNPSEITDALGQAARDALRLAESQLLWL